MHTLAPSHDSPRLQTECRQRVAQLKSSGAHIGPVQPLIWIKVKDQPVGAVQPIDPRAPDVILQTAHLRRRNQAGGPRGIEVIRCVAVTFFD